MSEQGSARRRAHARRSCELCKVRKTRCELPDPEVASGSSPLPTDKSCHRCRVLSLGCVVDDSSRKRIRRNGDGPEHAAREATSVSAMASREAGAELHETEERASGDLGGVARRGSGSRVSVSVDGGVDGRQELGSDAAGSAGPLPVLESLMPKRGSANHSLDLLHGLSPIHSLTTESPASRPGSSSGPPSAQNPDMHIPGGGDRSALDGGLGVDARQGARSLSGMGTGMGIRDDDDPSTTRAASIQLHGRPLELASAMLGVAYRKKGRRGRRVLRRNIVEGVEQDAAVHLDLDLGELIHPAVRQLLERGYNQLRVFHPHLQPLPDLFRIHASSSDSSLTLLLATTVYLASWSLPSDLATGGIRTNLAPLISRLQHRILVQQPTSYYALQAFEVLSLHAPFGVLPYEYTDLGSLAPARGQVTIATSILDRLEIEASCSSLSLSSQWESPETWLLLGLRTAEARVVLEDKRPRKPQSLAHARGIASMFTAPVKSMLWSRHDPDEAPAVLGRLAICDQLARLEELIDSLTRLRGILEVAAEMPGFDATGPVTEEFRGFDRRLEELDERHEDILANLAVPSALAAGWASYRSIRRKYELSRLHLFGLRVLTAAHFLSGSALPEFVPVSGPPPHLCRTQAIDYAVVRAHKPEDFMPVMLASTPASEELRKWGKLRGEIAESVLVEFAELQQTIVPRASQGGPEPAPGQGPYATILPLQELVATVVEAAKTLMEMQAGTLIVKRSIKELHKTFRIPSWHFIMRQVSGLMATLGGMCVVGTGRDGEDGGGVTETENFPTGCSNLVGSMLRTTELWSKTIELEGSRMGNARSRGTSCGEATPTNSVATFEPAALAVKTDTTALPTLSTGSMQAPAETTQSFVGSRLAPVDWSQYVAQGVGADAFNSGSGIHGYGPTSWVVPDSGAQAALLPQMSFAQPSNQASSNSQGIGNSYSAAGFGNQTDQSLDSFAFVQPNGALQAHGAMGLGDTSGEVNQNSLDLLLAEIFGYDYVANP